MQLQPTRESGFSLLELILVIVTIGILFTVAVDKLLVLKVEAERTAMNQVLASLRSAMNIQVASHISKNTINQLPKRIHTNPMDWLSEKPSSYIGVLDEPDPADITPGKWYFDSYNKYLVYRISHSKYFKSALKGVKRARFQIKLDYTDVDANGEFNPNIDLIHGLILKSIDKYQWLTEPINPKVFNKLADTNTTN